MSAIAKPDRAAADVRAFVAGATGYTGREVVRVLAERGAEVTAHVRRDSPAIERWRTRFDGMGARVDATDWEQAAMTATVRRLLPTHIFALLGTTRARARRSGGSGAIADTYEAVDFGLTMILLSAARDAVPSARFVYLSSIGASEEAGNAYLRVRGRVERALRESGVEYLIVRPSFITGPDREEPRASERIAAGAADAVLGLVALFGGSTIRDRYSSMTGAELATGMVNLALRAGDLRTVANADEIRLASHVNAP